MTLIASLLQMSPGPDKDENIAQAARLVELAMSDCRPRILSLPEAWTRRGGDKEHSLAQVETFPRPGSDEAAGPAYRFLRELARKHSLYVHGGSMPERVGDQFFNTTVVFDPSGKEIARYRKIHLFDVTTPDGTVYNESALVGSGEQVVTCEIDGIVVGLAICYDLRFPELFRALRDQGAEIIFLPANFTAQTGKDHWEPLLRARAIETECWFIAAATCGQYRDSQGNVRASHGHSLICDPWGHVVARASDGMGTTMGRIDRAITERVRREIPLTAHRRLPFVTSQSL